MLCVQLVTYITVPGFSSTYDRRGSFIFAVSLGSFVMLARVDRSEARPAGQWRQKMLLLLEVGGKLLEAR